MRRKAFRSGFPLLLAGILPTVLFADKTVSHVRVVRLSYVSGTVAVRRPGSMDLAKGMVNTPIQEGFELSTAANSYAEVEFENGSTARLGELSKITFEQLAIDETGNKLNHLTFQQGYATFHILPEHHDEYRVKVADAKLNPSGKSEFRADLEHGRVRLEVFSGAVEVARASETAKVGKGKTLEFEPGATQMALNAKSGIVKDSWDKWGSARDTQAQLSLADQAVASHGPSYGWSDLGQYGEWGFFPGFGYGWSPFVASGWSPYSMGMWSFYQGMGYTWISGEPWGWLPYHYGNWNVAPGFGWVWTPGNMAEFSPAMVNWYSGPGWIGWAPMGLVGAGGQTIVNAVPGSVVQNGMTVTPHGLSYLPATAQNRITSMPFQPGAGALLSGTRLTGGTQTLFTPGTVRAQSMAPASILMDGNAGTETALRGDHNLLRSRLGTTLGGHYVVGGAVGEFHGNAFSGVKGAPVGFSRGNGPMLMPHGQQASLASQHGGVMAMPSSTSASGPGVGSGAISANTNAAASSSHAASSGGTGHH